MLLGYARVSKSDDSQDTAAQVSALKSAGASACSEDKASGGRWDRPELHRLLDQLRIGDTLVVWKLDRLSRSLKDLLHILERVEARGARFRSLTEAVDTSGPAGRMLMQMLGSFAEFERAMVRERTRAGLKAAAVRGRKGDASRNLRRSRRRRSWTALAQVGRVRRISPGFFGCTAPPSAVWPPRCGSLLRSRLGMSGPSGCPLECIEQSGCWGACLRQQVARNQPGSSPYCRTA